MPVQTSKPTASVRITRHSAATAKRTRSQLLEFQRCAVHTVAKACRLRTIVEDMAKMRIALAASHLAAGTETVVSHALDVLSGNRLPEAWPTGAGLELCLRTEQGVTAAHATVQAFGMVVPILSSEGNLRISFTGDSVFMRTKSLLPLCIGEDDLFYVY